MPGYAVRHAESQSNRERVTRGTIQGVPLTPHGVEQAHGMGDILKNKNITSLRASDRRHVLQTANIISKIIKIPCEKCPQLRSLNIGEFTGLPQDEVDPKITKLISENSSEIIPGGESPKSWIIRTWPEIRAFLKAIQEGEIPAVVTHGRPLNLIRAAVEGNGKTFDKKVIESYPTDKHASIYRIEWKNGKFIIEGPIHD